MPVWTAREIRSHFQKWNLDPESREYLAVHARRYERLLAAAADCIEKAGKASPGETIRILDVGPGYQTELLRLSHPEARVDTLGFEDTRLSPRPEEKHTEFDLNDAQERNRWPHLEPHHLVVLAEVLEHLYTSPVRVLRFLVSVLAPGGLLLIQTPNACALNRRVKMLIGRNPIEPIRENRSNPGHFHEYTPEELREPAAKAGFEEVSLEIENYFEGTSLNRRLYNSTSRLLPPSLREGITLVLRRNYA